jgi:integron integrase
VKLSHKIKPLLTKWLVIYGNMDKKESWYNMSKVSNDGQKLLPEFQQFLLERKIVPEKNIPYFAYWVSRFLAFARNRDVPTSDYREHTVLEFLDTLRMDKRTFDWQPRQADDAIRLYYFHYLGMSGGLVSGNPVPSDVPGALQETRRLIRLKHYSYSTERTYLQWVERFLAYALKPERKIADLSSGDIANFLSHLALKQKISSSTQNQAFNAILFLFRHVFQKNPENLGNTVRAKRGIRLPTVLSINEVKLIFAHMNGTNLLIAEILYGSGLRLMELARLRIKDIDFDATTIFVRSGKGDNDRSTVLPQAVKDRLQKHLEGVRLLHGRDLSQGYGSVKLPDALARKYQNAATEWGWQYVFPSSTLSVDPRSGRVGRHHISDTSIQKAFKNALQKTKIVKHASVHTLRHCFATHLLQIGVNIREVQSLLGHKHVETTMIYTHVLRDMAHAPQSPLDALYDS